MGAAGADDLRGSVAEELGSALRVLRRGAAAWRSEAEDAARGKRASSLVEVSRHSAERGVCDQATPHVRDRRIFAFASSRSRAWLDSLWSACEAAARRGQSRCEWASEEVWGYGPEASDELLRQFAAGVGALELSRVEWWGGPALGWCEEATTPAAQLGNASLRLRVSWRLPTDGPPPREVEEEVSCPICRHTGPRRAHLQPCGHVLCRLCARRARGKPCPVCGALCQAAVDEAAGRGGRGGAERPGGPPGSITGNTIGSTMGSTTGNTIGSTTGSCPGARAQPWGLDRTGSYRLRPHAQPPRGLPLDLQPVPFVAWKRPGRRGPEAHAPAGAGMQAPAVGAPVPTAAEAAQAPSSVALSGELYELPSPEGAATPAALGGAARETAAAAVPVAGVGGAASAEAPSAPSAAAPAAAALATASGGAAAMAPAVGPTTAAPAGAAGSSGQPPPLATPPLATAKAADVDTCASSGAAKAAEHAAKSPRPSGKAAAARDDAGSRRPETAGLIGNAGGPRGRGAGSRGLEAPACLSRIDRPRSHSDRRLNPSLGPP